jgi:pyridoxamine 5'-phosphate oxidase
MSPQVEMGEPLERFRKIYQRAVDAEIKHPNAMSVSTVNASGQPTARMVLLKEFDQQGFVFYTNLESRKGRHLATSGRAGLNFYWRELDVQVVIEGPVEPVSDEEADAYFASRPRGSRLGAWASQQSRPLSNRARLLADVARVEAKYLGGPVPRPPHWSGVRVIPERYEFWEAQAFRLHDRALYVRTDGGWDRTRLYP